MTELGRQLANVTNPPSLFSGGKHNEAGEWRDNMACQKCTTPEMQKYGMLVCPHETPATRGDLFSIEEKLNILIKELVVPDRLRG